MSSPKAQRASSPTPATTLTCVIQTKPALKKRIEKVDHGQQRSRDAMSVDRPHLSFQAPSTSSIEFEVPQEIDPVVYASMQQPPSRKLKSPKPSLREDISPPRYTANNEKCSESQSGSASGALRLAPFRTLTHALPVFMHVIYCRSRDLILFGLVFFFGIFGGQWFYRN